MSLHTKEDRSQHLPTTAINVDEEQTEGRDSEVGSGSATSSDAFVLDEEAVTNKEPGDSEKIVISLSSETREKLGLKTEAEHSSDIPLHPALVAEWSKWIKKGLYEEDEEKKCEAEEQKIFEEIMKKFPRKETLLTEAPKLNPKILAYMSATAKNRDRHFLSSPNILRSAIVALGSNISLILKLENGEATNSLLHLLGNAGKLLTSLHYNYSAMRRAFILPGVDEKYKDLLKKTDITEELFRKNLFEKLKHSKSLCKVVEDLTPYRQPKKVLKNSSSGNRKSLPGNYRSQPRQEQYRGSQGALKFRNRQGSQNNFQWNKKGQQELRQIKPNQFKHGTFRFVLNLKKLNEFIKTTHFKLEDARMTQKLLLRSDYLAKLDLENAYYLKPMSKDSSKYLKFIFQGQYFEFTCLPFGLSVVPCVFTKLLGPVVYQPSAGEEAIPDSREIIKEAFIRKGMPNSSLDIFVASLSSATLKQYANPLRQWYSFCKEKKLDPFHPEDGTVIEMLPKRFEERASYSTLNTLMFRIALGSENEIRCTSLTTSKTSNLESLQTGKLISICSLNLKQLRSAISLVSDNCVGQSKNVSRLFKGIFMLRPSRLRYNRTWDIIVAFKKIEEWFFLENLPLETLTERLVLLLALGTAHRVQTLALIKISNVKQNVNGYEIEIPDCVKSSSLKAFQPILMLPRFLNNPKICIASTLERYMETTAGLRGDIDYIFVTTKKPIKAAAPGIISRWIRAALAKCKIDNNFTAHSTRHAATSAALKKGVSCNPNPVTTRNMTQGISE
ncbi:uncharacterized protein [Cardiocondyla obscurior]|uniref:uncharacterized protein n=1 Tax=Cardiocondyla obscurior TaxID=286306 RepID=UPI0039657647